MGRRFDVIVVGLGSMGSAACYHLARRGLRVLGLEQFAISHARGSYHGATRMIRLAYSEHPDYVPILRRAYELWRQLETDSGHQVLNVTGGLYMGPSDGPFVTGAIQAAERHDLPYETLNRCELSQRFGHFRLPGDYMGVLEPNAGFLMSERAVALHSQLAMQQGAELHGHEPVVEWDCSGVGIRVHTPRGAYLADRLIFCGGAWSGKLLEELGVPLVVTRQVVGWVWPQQPELFELGRLPVWAVGQPDGSLFYGFPIIPESPGCKVAHHYPATPVDPDLVDRTAYPEDEADFRPFVRRHLPDADGPLVAMRICLYTNSPDGHFIIDRYPGRPEVALACGFSGHGFKFASVVGEILADLTTRGKSSLPIGFLGLDRFRNRPNPTPELSKEGKVPA